MMRPDYSSAMNETFAMIEVQAVESAGWLAVQHRDGIIPPAEKIVLDCLRALQAIPAAERVYADQLTYATAKGFLETAWGARAYRRRMTALLEIDAEAADTERT